MFNRRAGHLLAIMVVAATVAACASAEDSEAVGGDSAVLDSAGVRIVSHRLQDSGLTTIPEWSVTGSPDWTFNRIPNRSISELFGVTGAVFLNDGTLVLGHGSDRELLYVDQTGRYVRSTGSAGSGPGEMQSIRGPYVSVDNQLLVYDPRQRRLTRFDSSGNTVASRNVAAFTQGETTFAVRALVGALAQGTALFELVREGERSASGEVRSVTQLAALDWSGDWRVIGPTRAAPSLTRRPPGASGALGAGMSPLAPRTIDVVCGNGIATSDTHNLTIDRSSNSGTLELSIRTDLKARRARIEDFVFEMGRPFTEEQRQSEELQRAASEMTSQFQDAQAPLVSELRCDEQGNVYAALAQEPTRAERRVLAFGSNGELRGQFAVPANWQLLAIQSNRVAVVQTDADDLESVSVYRVLPFARD